MKIRVKVELYVDITLDIDDRRTAEDKAAEAAAIAATMGFDDGEYWSEEEGVYLDLVETVATIV